MILYSIFSSQISSRRSRELCTVKLEYWEYMRRLFSVELQARILFFNSGLWWLCLKAGRSISCVVSASMG